MNQLQKDIIENIRRHGPMTTAEICEYLEPLGYGGNMSFDDFKRWIGKTTSKLRGEGHVAGEDRPNPGTKPVRYWALPEPVVNDQMTTEVSHEPSTAVPPAHYTEMDSDLAEIEQGEWSDAKTFECQPEQSNPKGLTDDEKLELFKGQPECTEWKGLLPSKPMSVDKAISEFREAGFSRDDMVVFMSGIAAAERHHGIAE